MVLCLMATTAGRDRDPMSLTVPPCLKYVAYESKARYFPCPSVSPHISEGKVLRTEKAAGLSPAERVLCAATVQQPQ
jgi:hypothetical protein